MDRLDELLVLTAILDAGSLAAAARRLRRSPPAITRSLAALEARVGARLFQRTSRQLTPTAAARRIAPRARQLLGDYQQTIDVAEENQGTLLHGLLRVTAPSLFGRWHIAPLVRSFLKAHPGVRAELMLTNRNIDLIEEAVDVGIRIGRLTESGLIARRVGQVRPVLSASPDYIAQRGRPKTPRDLKNHDIVLISDPPRTDEWRFRASGRELIVRLTPKFMVTEIESALIAVRAGCGITRTLSYQVADDFSSGALVRVLRGYELPVWPVHLVFPTARHMPHTVRAFLDVAAPALEALRVIHMERP